MALEASEACIHMTHETTANQEAVLNGLGVDTVVTNPGLRQTPPAPSPSLKGVQLPKTKAAALGSGF